MQSQPCPAHMKLRSKPLWQPWQLSCRCSKGTIFLGKMTISACCGKWDAQCHLGLEKPLLLWMLEQGFVVTGSAAPFKTPLWKWHHHIHSFRGNLISQWAQVGRQWVLLHGLSVRDLLEMHQWPNQTEQFIGDRNCCPPSPTKERSHNSSDSWMSPF